MRKVFLDDLPRSKSGKTIKWSECVGEILKFIYDDIEGIFEIVDYIKDSQKVKVLYKDKYIWIYTSSLIDSQISRIVQKAKVRIDFNHNIGEVVNGLVILDKYREKSYKKYLCKCIKCNYIHNKIEGNLEKGYGCPICNGNNVVHSDINSIKITHPNIYELIVDNDADKYSYGSAHKVHWKCPFCKKINFTAIKNLTSKKPTGCQFCGDGVSYPEKILYNVLSFVSDTFEKHKSFEWSEGRAYDAFDVDIFTEIHGSQHYIKSFERCGGRTLEEEIENDKYKHKLAINNHKNLVDYVVIKAYPETFDNIKQAILNSRLTKYYDFSKVDWDYVRKQAESSLVVEVGKRYNIDSSIQNLSEHFQIDKSTVYSYLRKATKLEICNYTPRHNGNRVRCRNTNEIFESMTQAAKWCNTQREYISECLKGIRENAGFHPITKEALLWELIT